MAISHLTHRLIAHGQVCLLIARWSVLASWGQTLDWTGALQFLEVSFLHWSIRYLAQQLPNIYRKLNTSIASRHKSEVHTFSGVTFSDFLAESGNQNCFYFFLQLVTSHLPNIHRCWNFHSNSHLCQWNNYSPEPICAHHLFFATKWCIWIQHAEGWMLLNNRKGERWSVIERSVMTLDYTLHRNWQSGRLATSFWGCGRWDRLEVFAFRWILGILGLQRSIWGLYYIANEVGCVEQLGAAKAQILCLAYHSGPGLDRGQASTKRMAKL